MDTDRLIRTLAADNAQRRQPVGQALTMALLVALPVAAMLLLSTIGMRADIRTAMRLPLFDLKLVVSLLLAISAIAIGVHLSRPETTLRGWGWLLLPVVILVIGAAIEMTMPNRPPMMARWMGHNAMLCLISIPLLALPVLAATLLALRQGAPSRPMLAGALAGLSSAGFAATIYATHCIDDSPLFVATWYTLAAALVTAIGALAGARWLKY